VATAGILLFVMGLATVGMAAMSTALSERPPLPPNPRASQERLVDARRADAEIQSVVVPWMRRLGFIAAAVGALSITVGSIF
jgi:hypothetical protein